MISVLTVTKRPERLKLVEDSLARQTYKDFEHIVETSVDKPEGYAWAFNRAMNRGIEKCKGDLIVSIQDSIWFPPDTLQKFAYWFSKYPEGCVSGVGDQYDQLDDTAKPAHKVWLDPRKRTDLGTFYECEPNDWEINFASMPTKLIHAIGGFDEEMDKHYGLDNVGVAVRFDRIGAKFYLDQTLESYSLKHDRTPDWDENNWQQHGFWEWFADRPVVQDWLN